MTHPTVYKFIRDKTNCNLCDQGVPFPLRILVFGFICVRLLRGRKLHILSEKAYQLMSSLKKPEVYEALHWTSNTYGTSNSISSHGQGTSYQNNSGITHH
jgi:hypothetical protein